jgi:flavin-dependent dehydrogenase
VSRHDVAIIGGGPAGAALAAELAAAGRDVALIEREAEPRDKVCGEFLSPEAVAMLDRLGIDLAALGAVPIRSVGISRGSWRNERPLPYRAMSLSRRALDEVLLRQAEANGAHVMRGAFARGLARDGDRWRVSLPTGAVTAREAALATGKHDLRGHPRPSGTQGDLVGFKMHLRLNPEARSALSSRVEIGLFPGGYGGLEPIEDDRANLCFVISQVALSAAGGGWAGAFDRVRACSARFEALLADATPLFERPLAISRIPYGLVRRTTDGPWLIGDQAAVIPSFAGEGVTFALHGAAIAARAMLAEKPAAAFQTELARDVGSQIRLATALSRMIVHPPVQRLAPLVAPAIVRWLAGATRLKASSSPAVEPVVAARG